MEDIIISEVMDNTELIVRIVDFLEQSDMASKLANIEQVLTNLQYLALGFFIWKVISVIYKLFNDIFR